ncbi:uncharacterized protein LOC143882225 isoform X1 [Tasmannia lanceolata]|uniref:uncharacterized protein LOC143882225 isoform X1 n=1 Tax=Tasmannia lanceolata TaxID=3420 RepID=UPI0040644A5C
MAKKRFYAVFKGREPGIYNSWEECHKQIYRFPGSSYKGFSKIFEAEAYLKNSERVNGLNADRLVCKTDDGGSYSKSPQMGEHADYIYSVERSQDLGCETQAFDSTLDGAPQIARIKDDGLDILPIETCDNETIEHVEHFLRFTSLSELYNLIRDNLELMDDHDEVNKKHFLFHRVIPTVAEQMPGEDYFDYDITRDLLHFRSDDHLFAYLGLGTIKNKNRAGGARYFHKMYTLEFAGISRGEPGKGGAGIVLKTPDDIMVCKIGMGLGIISTKFANLHAFIVGLELSLSRGIHHLRVTGNFDAIKVSVVRDECLAGLVEVADNLMRRFKYLLVFHVDMDYMGCQIDVMRWADEAVNLPDGCRKMDNQV